MNKSGEYLKIVDALLESYSSLKAEMKGAAHAARRLTKKILIN